MPLFFQQQYNGAQVAVWHITEGEDFFAPSLPPLQHIGHPQKRLQHYAGRFLLQYIEPRFPLAQILVADTRKPYLPHDPFHFSISHCGDFAAVCISENARVGVDIELMHPKIGRLQTKFCSEEEAVLLTDYFDANNTDQWLKGLTLLWSSKEALFKWYSLGGMDFIQHMPLQSVTQMDSAVYQSIIDFRKEEAQQILSVQNRFFDRLCLSFVVT